ncbi:riboflavin aldehyde-forming enzyme, partial [Gymnopus androsaceus JB14]
NSNPICNKTIIATYQSKSVTVAITDRCTGCANAYSLHLSPSAFEGLADLSVGKLTDVTWVWADASSSTSSSS